MRLTTERDINRNISEAFAKVLLENASDKKIKKIADEYFGKMGVLGKRVVNQQTGEEMSYPKTESKPERPMFYDSAFLTNQCSELVPNCTLASRKFMPAVARIILPKIMRGDNSFTRDADELNKILKTIVNDQNHLNEYDNDLNGLSIEELKKRFGDTVKKNLEADKRLISSMKRTENKRYKIIRCPEQKDLLPFGEPLTTWCVAQKNGIHNYNGYTNDGLGMFYVCLRDDYNTVKPVVGENAPLDDYGLSMIAVNVNDDGSLKNCTCRWNHANGGNDNIMDEKQLSDLLGVNFYDTFKPRGIDEAWEKIVKRGTETDISRALGGIEIKDTYNNRIQYAIRDDEHNAIKKMTVCYTNNVLICLAEKNLTWFNVGLKRFVDPPETIYGNIDCSNITSLKSLNGSPKNVRGYFTCSGCTYLTTLEGSPRSVGTEFHCSMCTSLLSLKGAPASVGLRFICSDCTSLQTLEGAPSIIANFICSGCTSLASLEGCPKSIGSDFDCIGCSSLISLEGGPTGVGGDFACSRTSIKSLMGSPAIVKGSFICINCTSLESLVGSPNSIGNAFNCSGCTSLKTLKGSPRSVKRGFRCTRCTALTSLVGSPDSVGGDFYCSGCTSLKSLEGSPRHIGGRIIHD